MTLLLIAEAGGSLVWILSGLVFCISIGVL
jgi:hypothetical protein